MMGTIIFILTILVLGLAGIIVLMPTVKDDMERRRRVTCQKCLEYEKLIAQIQADIAESEKCRKMMLAKIGQLENDITDLEKEAEFYESALQRSRELIAELEDEVDNINSWDLRDD